MRQSSTNLSWRSIGSAEATRGRQCARQSTHLRSPSAVKGQRTSESWQRQDPNPRTEANSYHFKPCKARQGVESIGESLRLSNGVLFREDAMKWHGRPCFKQVGDAALCTPRIGRIVRRCCCSFLVAFLGRSSQPVTSLVLCGRAYVSSLCRRANGGGSRTPQKRSRRK